MSVNRVDGRIPDVWTHAARAPVGEAWQRREIRLPAGVTPRLEREVRRSMRITKTPTEQSTDVIGGFAQELGRLAEDERQFHALLRQVYGHGYDVAAADDLRRRVLVGDFSWMPPIRWVDAETLQGGHGAYDTKDNVVFLDKDLLANPRLAVQTYAEECGAYLDTRLNTRDTVGDEGEMFRRLLAGEKLSAADVAAIRADDDRGVIEVDGEQVEVEFWSLGGALKGFGKGIASAVSGAAKGLVSAAKTFCEGIGAGVAGFASNLVHGRFGEAFSALGRGLDEAVVQAPTKAFYSVVEASEDLVNGVISLTGPAARYIRKVTDRVLDAGRSVVTGVFDAATGAARNIVEGSMQTLGGVGEIATGHFSDGFADMGKGLLKTFVQTPVDGILMIGGRVVSAVQTVLFLEPPGREVTAAELETLRSVYGDGIDYGQIRVKDGSAGLFRITGRPFTHGNTVYLGDTSGCTDDQRADGLVHESLHVWQGQHGGTGYMTESLASQYLGGHGYRWQDSVPATRFEDLEVEQQAQLVQDAYRRGFFTPASPSYQQFSWDVNGDGVAEDLTDYMLGVADCLREGRGAT